MGNRPVASRDDILDAAYDLAVSQGLGALSIRAVATACGVAVGTVYNSYPTKADLVNDVVGRFWREAFADRMGAAEGAAAETDFIAFCERLSREMAAALETFRADFLADLSALGAYDLNLARHREAESFAHIRRGLRAVLERDPAIDRARLTGPLAPEPLCDLVWEVMVDAARRLRPLDGTLFALLRRALY